ncbi:PPE family protein [Mycobacterium haemophilum DSM 44634]|uniref:PPE family protein n=1 Tax=Mycobacterium haemophilum TaxID=29311 RepID=UPI0009EAC601|nr:PPE family protein [Mycobacterium haemophilum]MCV7341354.1 PPE family protein [Mycobacterium haemophilum DSM 44634]
MPHSEGLPPEINSHNIWGGPGADSIEDAVQAWTSLRKEMWDLKRSFSQMLHCLKDNWSGPAAQQVIDAATLFLRWLYYLDGKIYETERLTRYVADAFVDARHNVVHPELIDTNRAEVLALINDNELGQNNAAIAALEDEYGRYWDQDGRAMLWYRQTLSAAVKKLTPWRQPPPIATNTGLVQPALLLTGS